MNDQKIGLVSLALASLFAISSIGYSRVRAKRYAEEFNEDNFEFPRIRENRIERREISYEGNYVRKVVSPKDCEAYDFDGDGTNDFYIVFADGELYANLSKDTGERGRYFVRVKKNSSLTRK
jgi:hypothetical protein